MIARGRGIFFPGLWKSKNVHSLEYLKYLYTTLSQNQTITEYNRELLVEAFRLIAEIIIWGDQNDSSIIEFFLEKNIMPLFLKFMNQTNGKMIYKQLLQTLSIMFENISDKASIYYLLSNNHINIIIRHQFDFEDEEVMAYYISFLKALSMKLNKHTIHFFYNENINDFALFNEAIKFFNHSESMVRTAVRNITLNIFKVADKAMVRYISNEMVEPYFSNLMWFIGNRILNIDVIIRNNTVHSLSRLQDILHEHLDNLHYINDILSLNVELLNEVLINNLLNKLYIPLYIYSLFTHSSDIAKCTRLKLSYSVSMFLLAHIFLIIQHKPTVNCLVNVIFIRNNPNDDKFNHFESNLLNNKFEVPPTSLEETLRIIQEKSTLKFTPNKFKASNDAINESKSHLMKLHIDRMPKSIGNSAPVTPQHRYNSEYLNGNIDEVNELKCIDSTSINCVTIEECFDFNISNVPCMEAIFDSFDFTVDKLVDDNGALISMCLLYTICHNQGVHEPLFNIFRLNSKSVNKSKYNSTLIDRLIEIFNMSVKYGSTVRLVTLELACILLETLACSAHQCFISDGHFAYILTVYEESKLLLRNYYKSEDIFVDMFEDEYMNLQKHPLNIEYLLKESGILLPQKLVKTFDLSKKLPSNDEERARYYIRVFLLLRQLCDRLKVEDDMSVASEDSSFVTYSFNSHVVAVSDKLDPSNKDIISCTIEHIGKIERRFLIVDEQQVILAEADSLSADWGVVKFVGFIQNLRIIGSKDDTTSLLINLYNNLGSAIHKYPESSSTKSSSLIFDAKFIFEDHDICLVAQKLLEKSVQIAYELKLQQIALMLDFPPNVAFGIKSSSSKTQKEYRSGYFGPKENIVENS